MQKLREHMSYYGDVLEDPYAFPQLMEEFWGESDEEIEYVNMHAYFKYPKNNMILTISIGASIIPMVDIERNGTRSEYVIFFPKSSPEAVNEKISKLKNFME
jgi:hypothetical protein